MSTNFPIFRQNDLAQLAAQQFALAHSLCDECLAYHALWPYLRLSAQVGGVEADQDYLLPVLYDLLRAKPQRVMIAGSADTGVTALVHHAASTTVHQHHIVVVDKCGTPLAACHQYGTERGLRIDTVQSDLRELLLPEKVDLVVGHSILPFLDETGRRDVLSKLNAALAPGGRLVLTTRLAAPGQANGSDRSNPPHWAAELKRSMRLNLTRHNVEQPCGDGLFDALIDSYAKHSFQASPHSTQTELESELTTAGFRVHRWLHSGKGTAFLANGQVQTKSRQGLIAVTWPKQNV